MLSISNAALEDAIVKLASSGVSEYFKIYLTLKAFGLTRYPPNSVEVDTSSTEATLYRLFEVKRLTELDGFGGKGSSTPFYNPLHNEVFKEHAARSIIQTHCKGIAEQVRVVKYPWLTGEQSPNGSWRMSFAGDYPTGLGAGRQGMAANDGTQIRISTPSFILWHFRYFTWDTIPSFSTLLAQMKGDLNLHESEFALLFDDQREFLPPSVDSSEMPETYPFVNTPLNQRRVAEFVAQRKSLGAQGRTSSNVREFSTRKMERMTATFLTTKIEDDWWHPADVESEGLEILTEQRSLLLVGPPGTGKTRLAHKLAKGLTSCEDDIHFYQLHAAYDYDTFIETLMPVPTTEGLSFQGVKRRFVEICEKARDDLAGSPVVVILDEFNRADIAKVFGETFALMENVYRDAKYAVPLTHNHNEKFWIPQNIYIIATMNNIDRSTFEVDFAVRRRFGELRVNPDQSALAGMLRADGCKDEELIRIACSLLGQVQSIYPLGHAYFKGLKMHEDLPKIFRRAIRPTIESYLGEFRVDDLKEIDKIFRRAYEAKTWEQFTGDDDNSAAVPA